MTFILKERYSNYELQEFSDMLIELSQKIGFKVSSRGWAYLLETRRLINKDQFDRVATLINTCRKKGFLPIDFVAEEDARAFKGVEEPEEESVVKYSKRYLAAAKNASSYYTPDWWEGEEYYIQMVVEKIDLVTLFQPVCEKYHIAIANAKGWSSILQRAEYSRRFKEAENKGLKCVLLYCGDHDPDGLRISECIRKNLADVKDITWSDGETGYDPENLVIDRFGLNYDFIVDNNLTWIDNLVTGSGNILARTVDGKIVPGIITKGKNIGKFHQNFYMPYMQEYVKNYGVRKCEANAIVTMPNAARRLVQDIIESYLGDDALSRFQEKRDDVKAEFQQFLDKSGLGTSITNAMRLIDNY